MIYVTAENLENFFRVKEVMSIKVVTVDETSSAYDATRKIMDHDIGCVVVSNDKVKVVGIITKGDILCEVVMKKLNPEKVSAKDVMSHPIHTISSEASLEEAASHMSEKNITKLPVLKNGGLVGIITSTDLLRKGGSRKIAQKDMI